jgi:hypothetical protein
MIAPTGEHLVRWCHVTLHNLYSKGHENSLMSGNFIRELDSYLYFIKDLVLIPGVTALLNKHVQVAIYNAVDG